MTAFVVDAIVTDIEGTTSSIAFVKDVLFPYAETRLKAFVAAHPETVAGTLDEVRAIEKRPLSADEAAEVLLGWSREDKKIGPLKSLQGMIWTEGYASGEIKGHIYPDSPVALRAWKAAGIPLYVYSSGSAAAQQLLFRHAQAGDLTPLFSGYFDTRIGGKLEAESYRRIAVEIGVRPERLLFLSDHAGEIAAAAEADWQVQLVDREGKAERSVASLSEISVERAA